MLPAIVMARALEAAEVEPCWKLKNYKAPKRCAPEPCNTWGLVHPTFSTPPIRATLKRTCLRAVCRQGVDAPLVLDLCAAPGSKVQGLVMASSWLKM